MIAYLFHCFQVLFLLSCFIVSLVTLFRKVAAVWIFASIVPLVLMVLYVVCSFMGGCVYIWRHVFSYCSRHLDRSFPNFKWILCCLFIFFFLGGELLERQTPIYFQKQQLTAVELLKYKSTHNSNWICWTVVCASKVVVLYPFVAYPSPQHFEDSTSANGDQLVSSDQNIYDDISNSRAHLHAHDFAHNMPAF